MHYENILEFCTACNSVGHTLYICRHLDSLKATKYRGDKRRHDASKKPLEKQVYVLKKSVCGGC